MKSTGMLKAPQSMNQFGRKIYLKPELADRTPKTKYNNDYTKKQCIKKLNKDRQLNEYLKYPPIVVNVWNNQRLRLDNVF